MSGHTLARDEFLHHAKMLREYSYALHVEATEQTLPAESLQVLAVATAHHANAILRALDTASRPALLDVPLKQQVYSEQMDALLGESRR